MLKMLKSVKKQQTNNEIQCIVIFYHKQKLDLFRRDDAKQGKSLIFIVVPQAEQVPNIKKTKRDVIRT